MSESITATELGIALGVHQYCTRETTCQHDTPKKKEEMERLKFGKYMEGKHRSNCIDMLKYAISHPSISLLANGVSSSTVGSLSELIRVPVKESLKHPKLPIHGKPDVLLIGNGINYVIEIKTTARAFKVVPFIHYLQCMAYMEIVNAPMCMLCVIVASPDQPTLKKVVCWEVSKQRGQLSTYSDHIMNYCRQKAVYQRHASRSSIKPLATNVKKKLLRRLKSDRLANCKRLPDLWSLAVQN